MNDQTPVGFAPSLDDLLALGRAVLADLPEPFAGRVDDVVVRVADWADEETLDALGVEDALELTGLFEGDSPLHRSVLDAPSGPRVVSLFRLPILFEWAERGDVTLRELVSTVMVHEIGHHFGLSDDDIDRIEASVD